MTVTVTTSGITFPGGTQSSPWPGNAGTVTSITAGSGLTGGTITSTGTIAVDTSNYAIGSYVTGRPRNATNYALGNTVAGTSLYAITMGADYESSFNTFYYGGSPQTPSLVNTGTWKCIVPTHSFVTSGPCGCNARFWQGMGLWVRVS